MLQWCMDLTNTHTHTLLFLPICPCMETAGAIPFLDQKHFYSVLKGRKNAGSVLPADRPWARETEYSGAKTFGRYKYSMRTCDLILVLIHENSSTFTAILIPLEDVRQDLQLNSG